MLPSYRIAFTPDGKTVYISNYYQNNVSVINTTTNTGTGTLYVGSPSGVAVAPDGTKISVVNVFGRNVIDLTQQPMLSINQPPAPQCLMYIWLMELQSVHMEKAIRDFFRRHHHRWRCICNWRC